MVFKVELLDLDQNFGGISARPVGDRIDGGGGIEQVEASLTPQSYFGFHYFLP